MAVLSVNEHKPTSSAVPRYDVFTLKTGQSVVRWALDYVQDIETGRFIVYTEREFSHPITDSELERLQASKKVEHFTRQFVWLQSLNKYTYQDAPQRELPRSAHRIRAFYIDTTLPEENSSQVQTVLSMLALDTLQVKVHHQTVAIYGSGQTVLSNLQDAELVLQRLRTVQADLFSNAYLAVFEIAMEELSATGEQGDKLALSLLDIDVERTAGKRVLLVGPYAEWNRGYQISAMLQERLGLHVQISHTAHAALLHLEEQPFDVVVIDFNLSDMHGWTLIKKIREMRVTRTGQIIVLSDNTVDEVFAIKVVKVGAFIEQPLDFTKLLHKIIELLYQV